MAVLIPHGLMGRKGREYHEAIFTLPAALPVRLRPVLAVIFQNHCEYVATDNHGGSSRGPRRRSPMIPAKHFFHIPVAIVFLEIHISINRLCGLVVRVPGDKSRVPGSIPSATRFSEK
jgi:hypothetical protein